MFKPYKSDNKSKHPPLQNVLSENVQQKLICGGSIFKTTIGQYVINNHKLLIFGKPCFSLP